MSKSSSSIRHRKSLGYVRILDIIIYFCAGQCSMEGVAIFRTTPKGIALWVGIFDTMDREMSVIIFISINVLFIAL